MIVVESKMFFFTSKFTGLRNCGIRLTHVYYMFVGDLIYIIGGASTQSNRILRSVECFDTSTKSWVPGVQDLPYPSKWIRSLAIVSK